MKYQAINLANSYACFSEQWQAHVIAKMNDYEFKVARVEGEYSWHKHDNTDEVFIIIEGELEIKMRDASVKLKAGEMFVVPKGVEHKPLAQKECKPVAQKECS